MITLEYLNNIILDSNVILVIIDNNSNLFKKYLLNFIQNGFNIEYDFEKYKLNTYNKILGYYKFRYNEDKIIFIIDKYKNIPSVFRYSAYIIFSVNDNIVTCNKSRYKLLNENYNFNFKNVLRLKKINKILNTKI